MNSADKLGKKQIKNRSTFFYQVRERVREFCILSKYKKTLKVQGVDPQEVVMSKQTLKTSGKVP